MFCMVYISGGTEVKVAEVQERSDGSRVVSSQKA